MNDITSRQELQKFIDEKQLVNLARGSPRTISLNLPQASIISSPKQGLASIDYILIENQNIDNVTFSGNWKHVMFNKCAITFCNFNCNFQDVFFINCNLANSNFTEAQNLQAEHIYTSQNLDQATFLNDEKFKSSISNLVTEERKFIRPTSFLAEITGDLAPLTDDYQDLVLLKNASSVSSEDNIPELLSIKTPTTPMANKNKTRNV